MKTFLFILLIAFSLAEIPDFEIEEEVIRERATQKMAKFPLYFKEQQVQLKVLLTQLLGESEEIKGENMRMITQIDTDGDKIISPTEIMTFIKSHWDVVLAPSDKLSYMMFHAASGESKVLTYQQTIYFAQILATNMLKRVDFVLAM